MPLWDAYGDVPFEVVCNHESQYSIWPTTQTLPGGWHRVAGPGTRDECLAEVEARWTDMRPGSIRPESIRTDEDQLTGQETGMPPGGPAVRMSALAGPVKPRPDMPVHLLIERAEGLAGSDVAMRCGDVTLSRAGLLGTSRAWAAVLADEGAGPEKPIGVLIPRGVDALVAILAILQAGSAYVPLSCDDSADRLHTILDDCGRPLVVSADGLAARLASYQGSVVTLGEIRERSHRAGPMGFVPVHVSMDNLAFIIYTSGTAGRPKGVEGTHRQLVNYALWCRSAFPHQAGEWTVLHAPLAFLGSLTNIFTPLLAGWPIEIAPEKATIDDLLEIIGRVPLGLVKLTPTHVRMMQARETARHRTPRQFMIGSEPLVMTDELAAWIKGQPPAAYANHYGLTETHGCFCHWFGTDLPIGDTVPIGKPIDNVRAHIVDEHGHDVPPGDTGELLVAGDSIGRGYHSQPALTAQRWIPDYRSASGKRILRTGDLARLRPDGTVEIIGRADRQVKVRGHRVEPGAVEHALRSLPDVAEALVLPRHDDDQTNLVAYLIPKAGAKLDTLATYRTLSGQLAPPSVPTQMVVLPEFPVNANGKVDVSALPPPGVGLSPVHGSPAGGAAEPATATEARLLTLWPEFLRQGNVGLTENFFAAGGHSLAAVQLLTRVQTVFGCRIQVRQFMENPTIRGLAPLIDSAGTVSAPSRLSPIRKRLQLNPSSYGQRRLWFLGQLEGPSPTYNIPQAIILRGPLDRDVLRAALSDLMVRHEVLRTTYTEIDGNVFQQVSGADEVRPLLEVVDADTSTVMEQVEEASRHCFDLREEFPIRAWLFAVAPDHHVLLILTHHIASDGASESVLLHDLSEAYGARAAGRIPGWPPLPVQYSDYVLWQQDLLGSEGDPDSVISQELSYYRRALAGAPEVLQLPFDRPRRVIATYQGDRVVRTLDAGPHRAILKLARANDSTLFMVVQAALSALLKRLGAGDDLPIGTGVAGRSDEALGSLIGFFVNTLVVRTDASGDPTFTELLGRVRESALGAFAHQDIPFDRVVEELAPSRSSSQLPLFQIMLMLRNDVMTGVSLSGVEGTVVPVNAHTAKFDLMVNASEKYSCTGEPAGLDIVLEYATDIFDASTVERIADYLLTVIDAVVAGPDCRVGGIELLSGQERRQVLVEWNGPASVVPGVGLAEAFGAQVARTPDAVAVSGGGVELSYAQLDARANRLAHRLVGLGVRAEMPVAVLMERSAEVVVATLAIVKAGGCYVPLHPGNPAAQLAWVLADTGARLLLTDQALADEALACRAPGAESAGAVRVLVVDADPELAGQPEADPGVRGCPGQLAFVMYTSGSTGRPKGVGVPQQEVTAFAADQRWRNGAHERVPMHSPYAFDLSTYELWVPLLNGGRVMVIPAGELAPHALQAFLAENKVTAMWLTSGLFRLVAEELPECFATVREVWTGGDTVPPDAVKKVSLACPGTMIVNGYGPTEATTFATSHPVQAAAELTISVPIGRPLDNTRIYVLDANLRLVPVGVTGELHIAGTGLARGYINQPALTARRFVADPYGPPGSRMYRTGDLARWRTDGTLDHLGRTDHQMKLRGFRIEPGEIEAALTSHQTVAQAVVIVREDQPGDKRLIAYVLPTVGHHPDPTELRTHLSDRLAPYMVPSAIVILDTLPLTSNGKVDRKNLPAPDLPTTTSRHPRDERDAALCQLFADVLNIPTIGIDDNFFELGGNSLLAAKLTSRTRTTLGIELGIRDLFEAPTVAGITRKLAFPVRREANDPLSVLLPLRSSGSRLPLFCIHPAAGIGWVYAKLLPYLSPDIPLYALQARGLTEPDALEAGIEEITADYVRQIRSVQASGPYHLLGWSFGGGVAHEAAVQLQAAGEIVALLAVLDGYPASANGNKLSPDDPLLRQKLLDSLGMEGGGDTHTLEAFAAAIKQEESPLVDLPTTAVAALTRVFARNRELSGAVTGRVYQGDMVFFLAAQNRKDASPDPRSWQPYVDGRIILHEVPAAHGAMMQPHALARIGPVLAKRLNLLAGTPTGR